MTEFTSRVMRAVRRIPAGRVATYGDIAAMVGAPRAWRAVGTALRACRDPLTPCHRVIGAGGALGGWTGPLQVKRALLRAEGLEVGPTRVRQYAAVRWPGAGLDRPRAGRSSSPGKTVRSANADFDRRTAARAGGRP